eukprot:361278-Chlamydomonas_euryale.AAC.12
MLPAAGACCSRPSCKDKLLLAAPTEAPASQERAGQPSTRSMYAHECLGSPLPPPPHGVPPCACPHTRSPAHMPGSARPRAEMPSPPTCMRTRVITRAACMHMGGASILEKKGKDGEGEQGRRGSGGGRVERTGPRSQHAHERACARSLLRHLRRRWPALDLIKHIADLLHVGHLFERVKLATLPAFTRVGRWIHDCLVGAWMKGACTWTDALANEYHVYGRRAD